MTEQELQTIKQRFGIIGTSPALTRDIETAVQVARTRLSVLISGENGVGKEHFPKIIHEYSARKHGPYFAINCGAIPEGTIDSELFGHIKGSFTGAIADRKGYFEQANNGTLFLDEVGELPLTTQARLLRVLETGEFIKMGESKIQKTNVRVIAATNVNLPEAIAEGRFREDLYYRLCAVEIHVPALRERPEDIPLLFRKFAADFAEQNEMPTVRLTDEARQLLMRYPFAGNVRQLKNIAEQVSVLSESREVSAAMLQRCLPTTHGAPIRHHGGATAPYTNPGGNAPSDAPGADWIYQALNYLRQEVAQLRHEVDALRAGQSNSSADLTPLHPQHAGHSEPLALAAPHAAEDEAYRLSTIHDPLERDAFIVAEELPDDSIAPAETIHVEDVPTVAGPVSIEQAEKELIREALRRNEGSRKMAASDLHISERTLYRKIKTYDL